MVAIVIMLLTSFLTLQISEVDFFSLFIYLSYFYLYVCIYASECSRKPAKGIGSPEMLVLLTGSCQLFDVGLGTKLGSSEEQQTVSPGPRLFF